MKWTAIVLLLGVFIVHDTPEWISRETGIPRNWLFYGLLGTWTAILSGFLALMVAAQRRTLWRDLALAALVISAIEGMEMPTCLVAVGVANVSRIPRGISLCDYAAGFPIGYVIEALYFFVVCWILGRSRE